jgi:molybdenum cofactor cytidylyltransferase
MIAGVILAAGKGSRIGLPKALLGTQEDAQTFVQRGVAILASAGLPRIIVVVSPQIAEQVRQLLPDITVCVNAEPAHGQLSSLHVAMQTLRAESPEALVVLPVDVPLVRKETVVILIEAWRRAHPPIVRPTRGSAHGHPVIFDARVFNDLLMADVATGAKSVVRKYASPEGDVAVTDDGAFIDIDTTDEYRRAFPRLR